jgi:hypothetical protein
MNKSMILEKKSNEHKGFQSELKPSKNIPFSAKRSSIQDSKTRFSFTKSNKEYIDSPNCNICFIDFGTITHKKKHW